MRKTLAYLLNSVKNLEKEKPSFDWDRVDLDGTIKEEEVTTKECIKWAKDDEMARGEISKRLNHTNHRQIIESSETAYELWLALKDKFDVNNPAIKVQLKVQFYETIMGEKESLLNFLNRMVALNEKLGHHGVGVQENELCYKIISALPKSHATLVQFLMMCEDKDFTVGNFREKFAREEMRLKKNKPEKTLSTQSQPKSNNSNNNSSKGNTKSTKPKKDIICFACGKKGHMANECRSSQAVKDTYQAQRKADKEKKEQSLPAATNNNSSNDEKKKKKDSNKKKGKDQDSHVAVTLIAHNQLNSNLYSSSSSSSSDIEISQNEKDVQKALIIKKEQIEHTRISWVIDSGCTIHMTNTKEVMVEGETMASTTKISGAFSNNQATLQGAALLNPVVNNVSGSIKLNDTLYVPELSHNLISVKELCRKGCKVTFEGENCFVRFKGQTILEGSLIDDLYVARTLVSKVSPQTKDLEYWHRVIGHVGQTRLLKILKREGIKVDSEVLPQCTACIKGKMKRKPFKESKETRNFLKGEYLHMDLIGPITPNSVRGHKYVLSIVDDNTDKSWAIPIKSKADAKDKIKEVIKFVKTQTGNNVKAFRCDRGTEFSKKEFKNWYKGLGIIRRRGPPYTPQHNGKAERLNQDLTERVRTMLGDTNLDLSFWDVAYETASNLRNMIPVSKGSQSPNELFLEQKTELRKLKPFGSKVFYKINSKSELKKLESRAKEGIYIDFDPSTQCYRILDPERWEIIKSREIVIVENNKKLKVPTLIL